jgi:hypothetical protein
VVLIVLAASEASVSMLLALTLVCFEPIDALSFER